jgi:hypothetical protein
VKLTGQIAGFLGASKLFSTGSVYTSHNMKCGSRFKCFRVAGESTRLRAAVNGIWERRWTACSNKRRVPLRDIAGDSLDSSAAEASSRLGRSLRGEARRPVDNAKGRRRCCSVQDKVQGLKGEVRSPTWRNRSARAPPFRETPSPLLLHGPRRQHKVKRALPGPAASSKAASA